MRSYYERHYGPNRSFLVVVGAIDKARTAERIRKLFGPIPRCDDRQAPLREPPPLGERRATMRTPHSVTRMCIGFPTCRMGERDDYALDLLAHDLGNGKNSRLYRRLVVEDELVTDVNVMNETRQDPGALFVLCELHEGVAAAKVETAVREEIARLVAEGCKKTDLQRIRTQIRASFLFQDESVLDMAMKLGRFEAGAPDGYRTLANVLPTYEALTTKDLQDVAKRYLTFDRAAVVWALPKASADKTTGANGRARRGEPAAQSPVTQPPGTPAAAAQTPASGSSGQGTRDRSKRPKRKLKAKADRREGRR
jgi:zinc protease